MENYSIFGKRLKQYELGMVTGRSEAITGASNEEFIVNIRRSFNESRLYRVEDTTKKLLMLTKPPKNTELEHIPYKNMFVDVGFKKEEIEQLMGITIDFDSVTGMIIQESGIRTVDKKGNYVDMSVGTAIRVICLAYNNNGEFVFNTFNMNVKLDEDFKNLKFAKVESNKATKNFCRIFAINFLNLLLDPDIVIINKEVDESQNKKRIRRGKIPIPASTMIKIDGERKYYINKLVRDDSFSKYSYRFWVQGHYRTLRAERYKENRGKRQWIAPFIKGEGILIEKTYKVDKDLREE